MSKEADLPPAEAFELALLAMKEGRWGYAAKLWHIMRSCYPQHPAPYIQGAVAYIRLEQLDSAAKLLEQARQHFPGSPSVWLVSVDFARKLTNQELEATYLREGIKQVPANIDILMRTAELAMRMGDMEAAVRYNLKAQAHANGRIEPLAQSAEIAARQERWEDSLAQWQEVIRMKPDHRNAYVQAAEINRQLGRPADAKKLMLAANLGAAAAPADQQDSLRSESFMPVTKSRKGVGHFLQMVTTKAWFNLKAESSRTRLNYAWVVLEPLLHLTIYYFVFGRLLGGGIENYGIFLLCGLVPWMWFAKSIATSSSSVMGGQGLMMQSSIPPAFFPMVSVVQSTVKQLPALLVLLLVGALSSSASISWGYAFLPLLILLQFLLTMALSMLVAAIIPFARDLANLVGTGLTLLMFISGVIYDYRSLPSSIQSFIQLNPMTVLIADYRRIVMDGGAPSIDGLIYVTGVVAVVLLFDALIYRHWRYAFPRVGME